VYVVPICNL